MKCEHCEAELLDLSSIKTGERHERVMGRGVGLGEVGPPHTDRRCRDAIEALLAAERRASRDITEEGAVHAVLAERERSDVADQLRQMADDLRRDAVIRCESAIEMHQAAEKRAADLERSRDTWMKLHGTLDGSYVAAIALVDQQREALQLAAFLTADEPEQDYGSGPECVYCNTKEADAANDRFIHLPTCEWWLFRQNLALTTKTAAALQPPNLAEQLAAHLEAAGIRPWFHAPGCSMWEGKRVCDKGCGPPAEKKK